MSVSATSEDKLVPGIVYFEVELPGGQKQKYAADVYRFAASEGQGRERALEASVTEFAAAEAGERSSVANSFPEDSAEGECNSLSSGSSSKLFDSGKPDRYQRSAIDLLAKVRRASAGVRLTDYHQNELEPERQFENDETTVSFLFRHESQALNGERFGERLCRRLLEAGAGFGTVVEIGAGTATLTDSLLRYLRTVLPDVYAELDYTIVELSPALVAYQKSALAEHAPRIRYVQADVCEYLPRLAADKPGSLDLLFGNEMLGDLPPATDKYASGVTKLLQAVPELLSEDGTAYFSEHGLPGEPQRTVSLRGHDEYSLDHEAVSRTCDSLGLSLETHNMGEFLGFRRSDLIIHDEASVCLQRVVWPFLQSRYQDKVVQGMFPRLGFSAEEFESFSEQLDRLQFFPVAFVPLDSATILTPFRFSSLLMRRDRDYR